MSTVEQEIPAARQPRRPSRARVHDKDCWQWHPLCALRSARDVELALREHHAGRARRLEEAVALAVRPGGPPSPEQRAQVYAAVQVARRRLAAREQP